MVLWQLLSQSLSYITQNFNNHRTTNFCGFFSPADKYFTMRHSKTRHTVLVKYYIFSILKKDSILFSCDDGIMSF